MVVNFTPLLYTYLVRFDVHQTMANICVLVKHYMHGDSESSMSYAFGRCTYIMLKIYYMRTTSSDNPQSSFLEQKNNSSPYFLFLLIISPYIFNRSECDPRVKLQMYGTFCVAMDHRFIAWYTMITRFEVWFGH